MQRIVGQTTAWGWVCPNRVSESTIQHETPKILYEDFGYDDVVDSEIESLTNLDKHLGTVLESGTILGNLRRATF